MVDLPAINTPQFDWALNKMGRKARPIAPIYQPEAPARAIVFAATHHRRDIWLGFPTIKAILANRVAPGLIDSYLAKAGYSGQLSDQRLPNDAPSNLFEPAPATTAPMAASTAAPGAPVGKCSPIAIAPPSGRPQQDLRGCLRSISWPRRRGCKRLEKSQPASRVPIWMRGAGPRELNAPNEKKAARRRPSDVRIGSPHAAARARTPRRYPAQPKPTKPMTSIAHVEGSGTARSKPSAQRACTSAVG